MCQKVLIVDDVGVNRKILQKILKDEYPLLTAQNGVQAMELMEEQHEEIGAVLLDLLMPEMDGLSVLKAMNEKKWLEDIPVLVISGEASVDVERECLEIGATDFIHKPFDSVLVRKRLRNNMRLFQYQRELEQTVEQQTQELQEQFELLQYQANKLHSSNMNIIEILGTVVEYRNFESGEHIKRVKGYTRILAQELQRLYPEYELTDEKIDVIVSASALHDIGKIAISDSILMKPGRLTDEEFLCMKTHTTRGCDILNNIRNVWDEEYGKVSYEICRYHHERFDGKGYPDGLKGEEIPIAAQIVSVADVYDALVNERVYKAAYTKEQAYKMIMNGECGMFSKKLLECFTNVKSTFEQLASVKQEEHIIA